MKHFFLMGIVAFIAFLSCRNDENDVQHIDQVLHLYIKDQSGKDLLNSKLAGAYQEVLLKDLGGIRDQVSISGVTLKKDPENITYLEYTAGARRNLKDSLNPDFKTYRSDIMLQLKKASADSVDVDTMAVFYEWTPALFRIKSVNYNGKKVFDKTEGQPNTVTIVK